MPIHERIKQFYPDNWDAIRGLVLQRATMRMHRHSFFGGPTCEESAFITGIEQCEKCSVSHAGIAYRNKDFWFGSVVGAELAAVDQRGVIIERMDNRPMPDDAREVNIVLTVAHLNHDPTDNSPDNLAALCQKCHLEYDNRPEEIERRKKVYSELLGQQVIGDLGVRRSDD